MNIGLYFLYIYLLCIVGIVVRAVLNIKNRWQEVLIGIGICLLIAYFHELRWFKGALFLILGIVSFFRGIFFTESNWENIFPRSMWWITLIFYMTAGFLYSRVTVIKGYLPYVVGFGFAHVVVSLFMLNFKQLGDATLIKDKKPLVPLPMKRQNIVLLIITLLIIVVIASFNTIKEFIKKGVQQLFKFILTILVKLSSLLQTGEMADEPPGEIAQFPVEDVAKAQHPIVEKILYVLGIVLTIIGIILLLRVIYMGLKKLIGIISKWIRGFFTERELHEESYGYVDEKESLIDMKKIREKYKEKFGAFIDRMMEREPKWEDLETNAERIRYIYRGIVFKYLRAGYRYKNHMTPIEMGQDIEKWYKNEEENISLAELISLYNRARYGDGENIENKEVEEICKNVIDKDGVFML